MTRLLNKRAKKVNKNRRKPNNLSFSTCCVHQTANVTRYSCLSPGTCVKRIKTIYNYRTHAKDNYIYFYTFLTFLSRNSYAFSYSDRSSTLYGLK
jgi:hypothetical protein